MENLKEVFFDYFVYQIFMNRGENQRKVKIFKCTSTGYLFAKKMARKHKSSFSSDIETNGLTFYFTSVKRIPGKSANNDYLIEFICEKCIKKEQSDFFELHRTM